MIYEYRCVDCGHKMQGEEICFDLAELLGIRTKENEKSIPKTLTLISAENLKKMAERCNAKLEHKTRVKIEITLKDFLCILSEKIEIASDRQSLANCEYDQDAMSKVFTSIWPNKESQAVVKTQVESLVSAIWSAFYLKTGADSDSNKAEDYIASCYIEAEFFEDGRSDKIYTVSYSVHDTVHMNKLNHPGLIRGYCPKCGAYIYDGAGKYEHILVGLLGVQSAGKTSVIVAMIQELLESYTVYGISYPGNVLCDTKWQITQDVLNMYVNGYPPPKTDAETSVNTFNASFLLESEEGRKKKIFTLVDIAGEQCYDKDKRAFNPDALQIYPLISGCSIYLLCTCISQRGYEKEEGTMVNLPYSAVMEVAKGIYANLDNKKEAPPLCILVTKSDMAELDASGCSQNPFERIKVSEQFFHRNAINMLKTTYERCGDELIRKPLDWCCSVFDEMQRSTYLTMMSCSAMGRAGNKCEYYPDDMKNIQPAKNEKGEILPVQRDNIDILWKWIFQVTGMVKTQEAEGTLQHIPMYTDSYDCGDGFMSELYRQVFSVDDFENRFWAVQSLFLNCSAHDKELEAANMEDLTLWERFRKKTKRSKMVDVVKSWN